MTHHRVLLIDDHRLVRAGLRALIDTLPAYQVVGEGQDGDQVPALVEEFDPDVLVMDIAMKRMSGLSALRNLRQTHAELPVIMLSMYDSPDFVVEAMQEGASGYLLKDSAEAELELALQAVLDDQFYLSPRVSREVIRYSMRETRQAAEAPALTPRQEQILTLLARGKATKEIAFELDVSVKTVETHRLRLMERLGIRDIPGLVRYAIRQGLVAIEDDGAGASS
ncbi:response regulator transcription factor [Marinobacteraceae bacterium S3BR75-40.1]